MNVMSAAIATSLLESYGPARDPELENKRNVMVALIAQIADQEWTLSNLLDKMAKDRKKADDLKQLLGFTQSLARNVKDPTKDDKNYSYVITFDDGNEPPFEGMTKVYWSGGGDPAAQTAALVEAGVTSIDYSSAIGKKMVVWKIAANGDKLTGKQKSSFYNQKESAFSSAISELNSISSQDNVLLQNYRSKIDTLVQLLSTLLDSYAKTVLAVVRHVGGN